MICQQYNSNSSFFQTCREFILYWSKFSNFKGNNMRWMYLTVFNARTYLPNVSYYSQRFLVQTTEKLIIHVQCFFMDISIMFSSFCFYHVTYAFRVYRFSNFLNLEGLLAQSRQDIWILSDCNRTWTCNHLDGWKRNWTHNCLNHKWTNIQPSSQTDSVHLRTKWL